MYLYIRYLIIAYIQNVSHTFNTSSERIYSIDKIVSIFAKEKGEEVSNR